MFAAARPAARWTVRRMATGESPRRALRGYALLSLLVALAAAGAGLAHWGQAMQHRLQREREAELVFRAGQIVRALESYRRADPLALRRLPERLDELLSDRRGTAPRHHLRRLWADPFTGDADWVLLRDPAGGIRGVQSRSRARPLRPEVGPPPGQDCVCTWRFEVSPEPAASITAAPVPPPP